MYVCSYKCERKKMLSHCKETAGKENMNPTANETPITRALQINPKRTNKFDWKLLGRRGNLYIDRLDSTN